jgi:hypothetical protein
MEQMEWFLSNLIYLKHLELEITGYNDLADGNQWEMLSYNLLTFNFKFQINLDPLEDLLHSFRTSYWLHIKSWYVAYDNQYLFSVPHFAPTDASTPYSPPSSYTTSNDMIFYKAISKLTLSSLSTSYDHYFPRVKTLEIGCCGPYHSILRMLDLTQVEHLILSSAEFILPLDTLLITMMHTNRLTIKSAVSQEHLWQVRHNLFRRIRTLEIESIHNTTSNMLEELFTHFPDIEYLRVLKITAPKDLINLIDGFRRLSIAIFSIIPSNFDNMNISQQTHSILSNSRRLRLSTFTCGHHGLTNDDDSLHISVWIGDQMTRNRSDSRFQSVYRWLYRHKIRISCLDCRRHQNT